MILRLILSSSPTRCAHPVRHAAVTPVSAAYSRAGDVTEGRGALPAAGSSKALVADRLRAAQNRCRRAKNAPTRGSINAGEGP
jgi:hypothetical protein